ncbi:MAG: DUF4337 domain-containing protein [Bacillota bacterium]
MAEIEIHHEHSHHDGDSFGKRIGVLVGVIGILLAGVTIASHREHTAAVIHKTEANDEWSYYQAKKIRGEVLDVGATLLGTMPKLSPEGQKKLAKMENDRDRYASETDAIQKDAEAKEAESLGAEERALRFDLGEGLLELGLVLCSLYFLSRKKSFPAVGLAAAVLGVLLGASGFLV